MKTIIPTTPGAVQGAVRETYGRIALNEQGDCCSAASSCCDSQRPAATRADELGYKGNEIAGSARAKPVEGTSAGLLPI